MALRKLASIFSTEGKLNVYDANARPNPKTLNPKSKTLNSTITAFSILFSIIPLLPQCIDPTGQRFNPKTLRTSLSLLQGVSMVPCFVVGVHVQEKGSNVI